MDNLPETAFMDETGSATQNDGVGKETFTVFLDGYEGPLDLLLKMAQTQKVDLSAISVLQLAEQYLQFINKAQALRLELAADYLVMAAWLTFLKSRLLLPQPEDDAPSGEELAARLAFQLERLEAMRRVAAQLMARDQLGRDFFARGMSETISVRRKTTWSATLAELLKAYARVTTREEYRPLQVNRRDLFSIDEALERLRVLMGDCADWFDLDATVPAQWRTSPMRQRSALASAFMATLELARCGEAEIRQEGTFAPLSIRATRRTCHR